MRATTIFGVLFFGFGSAHGQGSPDVEQFWKACAERVEGLTERDSYRVRFFGRNERTADLLLTLIRDGEKTVTFTSPWIYEGDERTTPVVGGYTVVTDFHGRPSVVLRTTDVFTKPFHAISEGRESVRRSGCTALGGVAAYPLVFFHRCIVAFGPRTRTRHARYRRALRSGVPLGPRADFPD